MRTRLARRIARRNAQAGLTLLEIMIVIAILGLLVVIVVPRVMGSLQDSKTSLMKVKVDKIVKEEYPRWATSNNDKQCPDTLLEVGKAVDQGATAEEYVDTWGKPFKFLCGDSLPAGVKGFAVYSFGEDGKDGTADDIKSWEKVKKQ